MIKSAAMTPPERRKEILQWRAELKYEQQPKIAQWGLQVRHTSNSGCASHEQVNTKLIQLNARVLPPPRVMYGSNRRTEPQDGSWNIRGNQVGVPVLNVRESTRILTAVL